MNIGEIPRGKVRRLFFFFSYSVRAGVLSTMEVGEDTTPWHRSLGIFFDSPFVLVYNFKYFLAHFFATYTYHF